MIPASIMKVQGPEEAVGILCPVTIKAGGDSYRTVVARMWTGRLIGPFAAPWLMVGCWDATCEPQNLNQIVSAPR